MPLHSIPEGEGRYTCLPLSLYRAGYLTTLGSRQ